MNAVVDSGVVDVVAVAAVVVAAVFFLLRRLLGRPSRQEAPVVVGAALQRGLQKARRRRAR